MHRVAALKGLIRRTGVPTEQRNVDAGTIKTSYLTAGTGKPVLFLHGAGKGGIQWYTVIGPLSDHFQVIVPDVVGYGESDKPSASYDRLFFSAWLQSFVDALGLEKVDLVGTSQGGAIALQFVLDNPERVDRLILVNSAGLGEVTQEISLTLKLRMMWQELFPSSASSQWFLEHYALFDARKIDQAMLDLEEYGRGVLQMPGGRRAFWQGRGRGVEAIPAEQLEQILHPTLLIWGEEDRTFSLSSAKAAVGVMPNAQLQVISRAGHICFLEQPAEFNRVLLKFLMEEQPGQLVAG
jgi:4,5:9,10-diseco-3-hydroxy-5,9,17-trioxoandrosta-1(10),2-diene-4-oate hydrolase